MYDRAEGFSAPSALLVVGALCPSGVYGGARLSLPAGAKFFSAARLLLWYAFYSLLYFLLSILSCLVLRRGWQGHLVLSCLVLQGCWLGLPRALS